MSLSKWPQSEIRSLLTKSNAGKWILEWDECEYLVYNSSHTWQTLNHSGFLFIFKQ